MRNTEKSCRNCYWNYQCCEDEDECEHFEEMDEDTEDLTEREEFYAEWNIYIDEDSI